MLQDAGAVQEHQHVHVGTWMMLELHRVHASIGVFAAITVATACEIPNTVAASLASLPDGGIYKIEHPSGFTKVQLELDDNGVIARTGIIRTARKLMDGAVYS